MSTREIEEEKEVSEVEQNIPVLEVDESLSVEERLTDNTVNNILPARYLNKDSDGNIVETPAGMFERVAENIAEAEYEFGGSEDEYNKWADEFEHLMKTQRLMPNSPCLFNAGLELQQCSACFLLEPKDDMQDILKTVEEAGLIFKSGGGIGYAFSHLRPKGALVESTKGVSSGPISFMRLFDETCNQVSAGGKRRGAQMGVMRADHPDIGRFAVAKRDEGDLDNFNISAGITDEFKNAVQDDEQYTLYSPQSDFEEPFEVVEATEQFYSPEYEDYSEAIVDENLWRDHADSIEAWDWENEQTIPFREKWYDSFQNKEDVSISEGEEMYLPARFIWDLLIDGAWRNGEPGCLYLDEVNRQHSFDIEEYPEYEIAASNPCAEQFLVEYESCTLAHINLSLVLESDAPTYDEYVESVDYDYYTTQAEAYDYFEKTVDFEELDRVIESGTRFLDNVLTMNDYPLDELQQRSDEMRKIGLGVMGWAQMCYQMGIRYGSEESLQMARVVMSYIDQKSTKYSHKLAKERGCFGLWDKSKYADPKEYPIWFKKHAHEIPSEWEDGYPVRNHNTTTVAPCGTSGMIADTTGGIEPVFSVAYKKNVGDDIQGDEMLVEFDKVFLKTLEENEKSLNHSVDEIKEIAAEQMGNNEFEGVSGLPVPEWMAETFVTTNSIPTEEHVKMQRAFQESVSSSISKTINTPSDAKHKDVHDAYMLALSDDAIGSPSKGLTVYRDQSREEQVKTVQEYSDLEIENAKEMLEDLGYKVSNGGDDE